jgi:acetyl-CoA hydrolase
MKIVSANELDLQEYLRENDLIIWGDGSGEPVALVRALIAQRDRFKQLRVFLGMSVSGEMKPEHADHIDFLSFGAIASVSTLQKAGVLTLVPCGLSAMPALIESRRVPVDVVFVQLSPPGPDGTYSFGFCNCLVPRAMRHARVVIAEINEYVPWSAQDIPVPTDLIDIAITSDIKPPNLPEINPTETDRQIARNVAGLIEDGDTLQFGIGAIPTALLGELSGHRGLGLHTGLFTDPLVDLIEQGVITNEYKSVHRGISVAAFSIGGSRLRDLIHNNSAIAHYQASITHGAATLSQIENLKAVNSALEVDLYGQVNAEQVGDRYIGTIGGQVDFMHAASTCESGLSIIAMPASAGKSGASRITERINGPVVTTARADVDAVVTEHGVADLRGKTLTERARTLVAIAPPEHRARLLTHLP